MVRKLTKSLASLLFLSLLLLGFCQEWLYLIGDYLVVEDTLRPADVIHVIAGPHYRRDYAIQLYKQGYAQTIFYTGGWCTEHLNYHAEQAKEMSLDAGVPPEAIAINASPVTSTYMEVQELKEWIERSPYPIRSVIVVSDPFHMRRANWTYRHVLGSQIHVQMAPVPFEQTPFERAWWIEDESRLMVPKEYFKLAYYLARYQYSGSFIREWLASLDHE